MYGVAGKIIAVLHVLAGLLPVVWLVYSLLHGRTPGSLLEIVVFALAAAILALGIGTLFRPLRWRLAMIWFHRGWLVLAVFWSGYFWYSFEYNRISGWGGLFYFYLSALI